MSYSDLLRDPRWQRLRLEVMEKADFRCVECGDDKTTLNVHHTYYRKGRMPWEYDWETLRCLCEPCHAKQHPEKRPAPPPFKRPEMSVLEAEYAAHREELSRRLRDATGSAEINPIMEEMTALTGEIEALFGRRRWKDLK